MRAAMRTASGIDNRGLPKFGNSGHDAARELWSTAPDHWKRPVVDRYLADLLEEMGSAAHVATVDDARLLNDVWVVGPGLAACESCRAVFPVKRRHAPAERRRETCCPACVRERADKLEPARRRSARAWWRPEYELEPCLGCVHRGAGPKGSTMRSVPLGQLYCSDACRKLVDRYIQAGGQIEAPRASGMITRPP
jgi:hypothetical protein